jgi:hypothetical protein
MTWRRTKVKLLPTIKPANMNSEPKKKNDKPSSNFKEEVPKGKVPAGDKAVKKPADEQYNEEEAHFKNPAKKREQSEQPVHPVKTPPTA